MLPVAIITEKNSFNTRLVEEKNSFRSTVSEPTRIVRINQTLPFRVRFTEVRVPGYGPNNIPGIGLQIIEYSNYIL